MVKLLSHRYFLILLILSLCTLLYIPSFNVPFYLDDFESIVNNLIIQQGKLRDVWEAYPNRGLTYVSFALNYKVHGLELFGFHLVNLLIHLVNALLIYRFTTLLLCTFESFGKEKIVKVALLSAGLFLILPLNTQAVVYIVQRAALLACMFSLISLIFYIKFRADGTRSSFLFITLSVAAFFLALQSKQNVVVLPLIFILYEICIVKSVSVSNVLKLSCIAFAGFLALQVIDFVCGFGYVTSLDAFTRETVLYTRWEYFTHQLPVIWMYIGKYFTGTPLLLEYGLFAFTWQDWQVWLSLFGYVFIFVLLVKLRKRYPYFVFLVGFYFISHLVESSFLPIRDVAFEHRTYLPNVGLTIAVALALVKTIDYKKSLAVLSIFAIGVYFSSLTYKRLVLWQTPMEFYKNELFYTHDSSRAYMSVAIEFGKEDNLNEAKKWFEHSITVGAETKRLQPATIVALIELLNQNGDEAEAKIIGMRALTISPDSRSTSAILTALASYDAQQGECEFVIGWIKRALELDPNNLRAANLLEWCKLKYDVQ